MSREQAYELYERAMENVFDDVSIAREILEELQIEMYNVDLSDSDYELLDKLLTRALISLDKVTGQ